MASLPNAKIETPGQPSLGTTGAAVFATIRRYLSGYTGGWDGSGVPEASSPFPRGSAAVFTVYISGAVGQKFELQAAWNPIYAADGSLDVAKTNWVSIGAGMIATAGVPLKQSVEDVAPFFRVSNTSAKTPNPTAPLAFDIRVWYLH